MSALEEATIKQQCKLLRMPAVAAQYASLAEQAIRERQTHAGYLEALLAAEIEERERNTVERRIKEAHLPRVKTLDEFDFTQSPKVSAVQMHSLAQGAYIEKAGACHSHRRLCHGQDASAERIVHGCVS